MVNNIGDILRLIWVTRFYNAALGFDVNFFTVSTGFFTLEATGFLNGQVNLFRFQIRHQSFNRLSFDIQQFQ